VRSAVVSNSVGSGKSAISDILSTAKVVEALFSRADLDVVDNIPPSAPGGARSTFGRRVNAVRRRFTLAHECAHALAALPDIETAAWSSTNGCAHLRPVTDLDTVVGRTWEAPAGHADQAGSASSSGLLAGQFAACGPDRTGALVHDLFAPARRAPTAFGVDAQYRPTAPPTTPTRSLPLSRSRLRRFARALTTTTVGSGTRMLARWRQLSNGAATTPGHRAPHPQQTPGHLVTSTRRPARGPNVPRTQRPSSVPGAVYA
jgi:hypothetical protein